MLGLPCGRAFWGDHLTVWMTVYGGVWDEFLNENLRLR